MPTGSKNNLQKIFASRWFLLVLLLIAIFVAVAYGRAYYRDYQVRQEINRLQEEVKKLEAKKIETMEVLQYVRSDAFIEDKARTELNMIKPGEKVVIVASTSDIQPVNVTQRVDFRQDLPNPVKWWRFFFGDLHVN